MLDSDNASLSLPITTKNEPPHHLNSVDATSGQPIVARVMTRKHELEALLAGLPEEDLRARGDIDLALSTINELLTGDLTNVPAMVVSDMSRWLELNKHLAESADAEVAEVVDPVTSPIAANDKMVMPGG